MILYDSGNNYRFDPSGAVILLELEHNGDWMDIYHHPKLGWLKRHIRPNRESSVVWHRLKLHELGTGYRCVWTSSQLKRLGEVNKVRHYTFGDWVISISPVGTHIWVADEFAKSREVIELLDRGEYDQVGIVELLENHLPMGGDNDDHTD